MMNAAENKEGSEKTVCLPLAGGREARVVVVRRPRTVSTMEDMAAWFCARGTELASGRVDAVLVCADVQTGGRGSGTRAWCSVEGNLHCNVGVCQQRLGGWQLCMLPLCAAVALRRALCALVPACAAVLKLKWPNDVVDSRTGRKLAGMLLQASRGFFTVGVGANIAAAPDAALLLATRGPDARQACCLAQLVERECGKNQEPGVATRVPSAEEVALRFCACLLDLTAKTAAVKQQDVVDEWWQHRCLECPVFAREEPGVPLVPLVPLGLTEQGLLRVLRPDGTATTLVINYLV